MSSTTLARATAALLSVFSILAAAAPARGATRDDWWQAVERRIREAEYSVTWQDATPAARAGLQAPNRAQGLRTWFAPDGVRIVPRREQVPSWSLELELVSIGMGRDEEAPAPAEPIPNGNRVPDGAGVDFLNTAGAPVLRYDHLLARDAARRALPARFRLEGMLLAIEVDVAAALFPVVIDPLAAAASWQAEGNQQGAQFGISVETAGDVNGDGFSDLVAGANLYDHGQADEGRAFLFLGSPSGLAAAPVWTAESDQANANFGISVRTAGDVNGDGFSDVIVGAMQYTAASDREGRAYVYHGSPAGLSGAAAWSADGEQAISFFGWSVGTAGDVNGDGFSDVIVGAPFLDDDQNSEGRVYVYHGSASGLSPAPTRTFSGDQNVALLGWSVGTAGDVNGDGFSDVILGAPMHLMPPPKKGFARVYHGSASGLPAIPAWVGFSPSPGTEFGLAVSGAGDVNGDGCSDVVVGAGLFASGQAEEGALYAYLGSASGLAQSAAWKVEGEQAGLKLGGAVSSAGDVNGDGCADVVAGAEGEARVYLGSIAGLALTPAWTADGGLAGGRFGGAVGLAGDVNGDGFSDVAVGAPQFDGGEADEGCACVFFGGASGVPGVAAWTCDGGQGGEALGAALADAGDVNGDGHADFLVGARGFDAGQADAGRVLLFHGSAGGPGAAADWVLDGVEEGAALGAALAGTGDVNGDGCSDVLLGAPLADAGKKAADAGAAYLHLGSTSGLASLPAWTIAGAKAGQTLGAALAAAGDVNGDGYADFLIGEPGFSGGEAGEGRASLFLGSKWGPGAAASWAAEGGQEGAGLGSSLAGAGDVDGDGFADVLAGAPGWDGAAAGEGQARLFLGSAFGLAANPAWSAAGGQAGARFGAALRRSSAPRSRPRAT
ncbi:MAG: FG-GAP repeat protein [Planctomycetes bacterium]|nr:FG-GAP repeat protein [Planctomycetota bacterium]